MNETLLMIENFHKVVKLTNNDSRKLLMNHHLTPLQQDFVETVIDQPSTTVTSLAQKFNITKSAASQVVTALVQLNYLVKKKDHQDSRRTILSLGLHGKQYSNDRIEFFKIITEKYSQCLDQDELVMFNKLLIKLASSMEHIQTK